MSHQLDGEALRRVHASRLEARFGSVDRDAVAAAKSPEVAVSLQGLFEMLQESEVVFVELMDDKKPREGDYEYGPSLYLIHTYLPTLGDIGKAVLDVLEGLGLPDTTITTSQWNKYVAILNSGGRAASDGTLVADSKYAVADPDWLIAVVEYILLKHGVSILNVDPHPFNQATVLYPVPSTQSELKIAIVGDWGSGVWKDGNLPACPSQAVMEQIGKLDPPPDLTIHLGDVYYAGTESKDDGGVFYPDEEIKNFVDLWKPGTPRWSSEAGGSFTLNSNHEMYSGANGYFKDALSSPLFAAQKNTSYFAITFQDWIVIGLDTAYYDTSTLIMNGSIGGVSGAQAEFLTDLGLADDPTKKVMVLTHHTGLTTDGTDYNEPLWSEVVTALGRQPDVWYWGHVHNGIVYSDQSKAGSRTKCRCVGHGALPFGTAYGLQKTGTEENLDSVSYFANTPLTGGTVQQENRVLNGFAVVTLSEGAITEQLIDQNGNVAWHS